MARKEFFDHVRAKPFGGSLSTSQVAGLNALLDYAPSGLSIEEKAYCLATAFHETARTMRPIEEYGKGKGRPYGMKDHETGAAYYGRGFCQLTWKANYLKAGKIIGADLVHHPELAMEPENASLIIYSGMREGWFTGKKLSDYFGPGHAEPVGARRIINGTDKAALIAGYWGDFVAALRAAGDTAPAPVQPPVAPATPAPPARMVESSRPDFWTRLTAVFRNARGA